MVTGSIFIEAGLPLAVSLIAFLSSVFVLLGSSSIILCTCVHLFLVYGEKFHLCVRISLMDKRLAFLSID